MAVTVNVTHLFVLNTLTTPKMYTSQGSRRPEQPISKEENIPKNAIHES